MLRRNPQLQPGLLCVGAFAGAGARGLSSQLATAHACRCAIRKPNSNLEMVMRSSFPVRIAAVVFATSAVFASHAATATTASALATADVAIGFAFDPMGDADLSLVDGFSGASGDGVLPDLAGAPGFASVGSPDGAASAENAAESGSFSIAEASYTAPIPGMRTFTAETGTEFAIEILADGELTVEIGHMLFASTDNVGGGFALARVTATLVALFDVVTESAVARVTTEFGSIANDGALVFTVPAFAGDSLTLFVDTLVEAKANVPAPLAPLLLLAASVALGTSRARFAR